MEKIKKLYLTLIEQHTILPNFFISETYLNRPDFVWKYIDGWVWIEENGQVVFPPLPIYSEYEWEKLPVDNFWCGFISPDMDYGNQEFLDYNYLYDPKNFCDLSGSKWTTFRKNYKKFPNRNPGWKYSTTVERSKVYALLDKWLMARIDTAEDSEFIIDTILKPSPQDYIRYLHDGKGNLVAINYADENYMYINYRFLICDRTPFADEFARYCFYTDPYIGYKNKLVNDGGTLGNEGLEKFKDKLNPVEKIKLYSWKS
jgi:hypothetical protein